MAISNKQLSLFHVALKQTGANKEDILAGFGVTSLRDLTERQFEQVMDHFKSCGFVSSSRYHRPAQSKKRLLAKVLAIRSDLGLTEAYVDGIVHRMFKDKNGLPIASHRWLSSDQLHKLVAALTYHQRRRKKDVK